MAILYLCACALFIGALEGVTEWLPISSTGHMILFDELLGMKDHPAITSEFYAFFLVAIQLGAILSVVFLYFDRLFPFSRKKTLFEKKRTWRLWLCVLLGALPAAVVGIPLDDFLEKYLYGFPVVAAMLILYGIAFIVIERRRKQTSYRLEEVSVISYRDAFWIGCFQVLSLIPGTSRSGATVLGGMLLGISRTASAEFSFFMAIPVMLGASLVRGVKFMTVGTAMTGTEFLVLFIGFIAAFLVSLLSIRFFVSFVKRHSFEVFGWYRIFLGGIVLLFAFLFR